ncbi:glutamate receptor ionotropic, delta-2-like [Centruroides vittatus]|uniref:glutamate receptor ionotropic, delta-2-like n=1 Tax=Centruroides vittatus TaxID=120091 RepID=UPI00350EBEDD
MGSEKVKEKRFAIIVGAFRANTLTQNDPQAYIVSADAMNPFIVSYAVRKGFPFKKELSKTVTRLFEAGVIKRKDYAEYAETSNLLKYSEFQALQLANIISPMMLLSIGFVPFFKISQILRKYFTGEKNNSYVWKIVGLQNPDYMRLDETETKITGGFYFHVFTAVQQKLKFRYSIVKPIPEDFGRRSENGSWTGLLAKMVNKVWFAILSTVFIFGLVLHKIVEHDFMADEVGILWSRSRVFWNLFCTFVYQGINLNNVKRFKSRLLLSIWWLSVVVLMGSYSGTLMSFMSYPLTESVPKSFDELAIAVKNGEYSCGIIGKTVIWTYMENSKSIRGKVFKDHMTHYNNFLSFSTSRERVKKERFALIYSEYGIRKVIKNDLQAYIVSADAMTQFVQSYAVRKGFPFKKELSKIVTRLFEAGVIERKDYAETTKLLKYSEFQALELADIISPMILLSIGLLLASMCLFAELFHKRIIKN